LIVLPILSALAPWLFAPMTESKSPPGSFLYRDPTPAEILGIGFIISVLAGLLEEISFRWLIFLGAFLGLWIMNFIFAGFLVLIACVGVGYLLGALIDPHEGGGIGGFIGLILGVVMIVVLGLTGNLPPGLLEWIHLNITAPIADWTTFGALHDQLYHPAGWLAGAAVLSANAGFRDGHKYQGILGYVNSWFLGMVFFWLMFTYGLLAAILVHFLYDLIIFAVTAGMKAVADRNAWRSY